MIGIKVETAGGRVRLERKSQSFVLPIDEAPGLTQSLLKAIRAHTIAHQRKTFEGEMAGETK